MLHSYPTIYKKKIKNYNHFASGVFMSFVFFYFYYLFVCSLTNKKGESSLFSLQKRKNDPLLIGDYIYFLLNKLRLEEGHFWAEDNKNKNLLWRLMRSYDLRFTKIEFFLNDPSFTQTPPRPSPPLYPSGNLLPDKLVHMNMNNLPPIMGGGEGSAPKFIGEEFGTPHFYYEKLIVRQQSWGEQSISPPFGWRDG